MSHEEKKGSSAFAYMVGGFALGAVCGLLLAPKKGTELISDIGDWSRDTRKKSQDLLARAKEYLPHREKREAVESES
ncbi:MAG: YtxH domain-containing protein [Elusimicrobia bacterium]|nr:YtxH domain-containing protein [Elusimicrobiota bacterium]